MREAWCSFSSSKFKLQNFYYELKLFSNFDMAAKRVLNALEPLKYLEDLKVSSSDESDFQDEFVSQGRLALVPTSNVEGRETDEDSGEENGIDPNHLNKHQLLSNAQVELNTSHDNVSVGVTDSPEPTKENVQENRKKSQKPKLVCH